ncbi:MAG: FkbM family methyltransferase [Rhodobacteraceae bacterium]|nr:FkbM family methyltransferase [Paracoccaceae bacterium]
MAARGLRGLKNLIRDGADLLRLLAFGQGGKTYQEDLIFDIGMHNGTDTEFYLKKGFRVVGVDANVWLARYVEDKLGDYVASGRLKIENVGIHNVRQTLKFYLNLDEAEWSSFEENLGTRQNTRYEIHDVACKRLGYFVRKYGMPYFLKIDVEGVDAIVVRELLRWEVRPKYLSVEDSSIDVMIALYESGARKFRFINQLAIRDYAMPKPAREGKYVDQKFDKASSGPFGADLPDGEWLGPEEAFAFYLTDVRPPGQGPIDGWWDIHVTYE